MPRARLTTGARTRIVANRNRPGRARSRSIDGVKTGHTQNAGYVLVGAATRKGARLVTVVLGRRRRRRRATPTRSRCCATGSRCYRRVPVVRRGATLARAQVEHFGDREARLVAGPPRVA